MTFGDFRKKRNCSGSGYRKIHDFCTFARTIPYEQESWDNRARLLYNAESHGIQWVWIDTVCIDKKSSAELSEAINSMYHWYAHAQICLAYLADVQMPPSSNTEDTESSRRSDVETQLQRSRWFTRGWTLQELVAPGQVVFVDRAWNAIGTKNPLFVDANRLRGFGPLTALIASITGIPNEVLSGITKNNLAQYSVAQRMSWAANRYTTRVEDMAYCLLGLFGINMPLLYGEGRNAFRRLQEELVQGSSDSIFAWKPRANVLAGELRGAGMLARSPAAFAGAGDIVDAGVSPGWLLSRQGPGFHLEVATHGSVSDVFKHQDGGHYLVRLQCSRINRELDRLEPCVMILQKSDCGHWRRVFDAGIFTEYDVRNPEQYAPENGTRRLDVHATNQDHLQCRDRLARHVNRAPTELPLNAAGLPGG